MNKVKQKKITIGIVLPYLNSRGPDRQALRLAKGFIKKGAEVVIFVVQGWGNEDMYNAFRETGAIVVNVGPPEKVGQKVVNLSRLLSLAVLAVRYRCNVLLSRAGRTNQICGLAGLINFIPTILVISLPQIVSRERESHGFLKQLISRVSFLKNFGSPEFIVSVSKAGADSFIALNHFYSGRIKVIPNGVEVSNGEDSADGCVQLSKRNFNICFSGSLQLKRKGLDLLLDAMKHLVFELGLNRAFLVLIGAGEDESELKKIVRESGLANHVMFMGEQSNPFPIIKQSDVFILPSRHEGMPSALLEAMSLGICCISTDCKTGPKEIIENGKNGILVPTEDSRALAEAISRMERDDEQRKQLARNGFKTVAEKFSFERMVDSYYESIMKII